MSKDEALSLLKEYCEYVKDDYSNFKHLTEMYQRFPKDGPEDKAMRWLGYMQGYCVALEIFSFEDVKAHSRNKTLIP